MRALLPLLVLMAAPLSAAELTLAQAEDAALRKSAFCVTDKARWDVIGLMGAGPGTKREQAAFVALEPAIARCKIAPPAGEMGQPRLRAALARAIYMDLIMRITKAGDARSPNSLPTDQGFAKAGSLQTDYRMAMCVYQSGGDRSVDSLIRSSPGSPAERKAMEALLPKLTACVDKDQQFSLRPRTFRMTLEIVVGHASAPLFQAISSLPIVR